MNVSDKKVSDDRIEKWQVWMSRAFSFALCGAFYAGLVYLAIDWFGHYIVEAIDHFTRP
jgi:hypothetical protein